MINGKHVGQIIRAYRFLLGVSFLIVPAIVHGQSQVPSVETDGQTNHFARDFSLTPPAVSQVNGKISYAGGNMNSAAGNNFDGSISVPICHDFGFQADGLYSRISDMDFYGGAGHLFWRNPNHGLIGVTGGYLNRTGVDTFHVGAEGEYYFKRFTFGVFTGVGSINYANPAPFISTDPTRFIGRFSADYYVLNDLRLGFAYTTAFENNLYQGNIEYQTPINGLALTGEVAKGDFGYDHWLLGLKYYFGGNKSLIQRQRQDDPPSLMHQVLYGLGVYGAEYNRKGNEYVAAHRRPVGTGIGSSGGSTAQSSWTGSFGSYGVVMESVNFPVVSVPYPPSVDYSGDASSVRSPLTPAMPHRPTP